METYKQTGLLTYLDEAGNQYLLYPITNLEAVEGLEEAMAKLNSSLSELQSDMEQTADTLEEKADANLQNMRTYTAPEQFGCTNASTISELYTALPAGSMFLGNAANLTDESWNFPSVYGFVQIIKAENARSKTFFWGKTQEFGNYMAETDSNGAPIGGWLAFLTDDKTVTVAQGGTGASTAAGARANLGVEGALKLSAVWTNASPESAFAAQTVTLSDASDLDVALWIVEFRGQASDSGSSVNTIAFPGHGTFSSYWYYDSGFKYPSRNVQISGTSAVFKDCYIGSTVDNTCLVPYRIYAVHKA